MSLPKSVRIREVGPREGFQNLAHVVPTDQKLELINQLSRTGVGEIEVASFVRADRVPQMADAEAVVQGLVSQVGVRYTALYLNQQGFTRAEAAKRVDNSGWISIAASETFLKKNSNTSIEKIVNEIPEWIATFKKYGKSLHGIMVSSAFGCTYEGRVTVEKLISSLSSIVATCEENGATISEICLADTVGLGDPEDVRRKISAVRQRWPKSEVSLHLHDTKGIGLANAYAGLLEGVTTFDASVAGLGGCPFTKGAAGNIATEDLVYMCEQMGVATGIILEQYIIAANIAERLAGSTLPGRVYRSQKG